jgi:hypothetical protein
MRGPNQYIGDRLPDLWHKNKKPGVLFENRKAGATGYRRPNRDRNLWTGIP